VGHVSGGFGGTDVALLKLNGDGVVSWQTSFGSNADDGAAAVATDDEGYIYVAGYTYGRLGSEDPQGPDAWVSKRKPDGTSVWIRQFGTDGSDGAQSIAVHGNRVYVAGYWGSGENFTHYDMFVRSYALDGTDPRTRTLGMAVTSDRVFVCGDTSGPFGATNAGEYDAFVAQVVMP
jgi:Beta-propeller repeat